MKNHLNRLLIHTRAYAAVLAIAGLTIGASSGARELETTTDISAERLQAAESYRVAEERLRTLLSEQRALDLALFEARLAAFEAAEAAGQSPSEAEIAFYEARAVDLERQRALRREVAEKAIVARNALMAYNGIEQNQQAARNATTDAVSAEERRTQRIAAMEVDAIIDRIMSEPRGQESAGAPSSNR